MKRAKKLAVILLAVAFSVLAVFFVGCESGTQEEGSGALNFTVTAQKDEGMYCGAKDKVYAGILSAGKIYRSKLVELGTRGAGESVSVTLPDFFDGELHVYAFARAAKGKMASTSMYLPLE